MVLTVVSLLAEFPPSLVPTCTLPLPPSSTPPHIVLKFTMKRYFNDGSGLELSPIAKRTRSASSPNQPASPLSPPFLDPPSRTSEDEFFTHSSSSSICTEEEQPFLLWDLLEGPILDWAGFEAKLALGSSCRRLELLWRQRVHVLPTRLLAFISLEQLRLFPNLQELQIPHSAPLVYALADGSASFRASRPSKSVSRPNSELIFLPRLRSLRVLDPMNLSIQCFPLNSPSLASLTASFSSLDVAAVSTSPIFSRLTELDLTLNFNLSFPIRSLPLLPHLRSLSLIGCSEFTEFQLPERSRALRETLPLLTQLTRLRLRDCQDLLPSIYSLPSLSHLAISGHISPSDESVLSSFTNLNSLDLFDLPLSSPACLSPLTQLRSLSLVEVYLSSDVANPLPRSCNSLIALRISVPFTVPPGGFPNLQVLERLFSEAPPPALLSSLTSLRRLKLTQVTDTVFQELPFLTNLTELDLCGTGAPTERIPALPHLGRVLLEETEQCEFIREIELI